MTEGCTAQGERIAPYVDGELDADEADAFALHLAGCGLCRDGLHDALQLAALEIRAGSSAPARVPAAGARAGGAPASTLKPRTTRERARRWSRSRLALTVAALRTAS